eukprot:1193002-Prorocentrum_minimum.AAC.4
MPRVCTSAAKRMPRVCTSAAKRMPSVCTSAAKRMPRVCTSAALRMPCVCTSAAPRVHTGYPACAHRLHLTGTCGHQADDISKKKGTLAKGVVYTGHKAPRWAAGRTGLPRPTRLVGLTPSTLETIPTLNRQASGQFSC